MPASCHAMRIVCIQEDNEEIRMFAAAKRKMMKMRMDKEQQLQRCVYIAFISFLDLLLLLCAREISFAKTIKSHTLQLADFNCSL